MAETSKSEFAIIGAILLENSSYHAVAPIVRAEDFSTIKARACWVMIEDLVRAGKPIDHITLGGALKDAGRLGDVGGAIGLSELTDAVATTANVEHYAKIVRDHAVIRRTRVAAQGIVEEAKKWDGPVEDLVSLAREMLSNACAGLYGGDGPKRIHEGAEEIVKAIMEQRPVGAMPTGFAQLDRITGGLWDSLLTVIAGRPGMGKSAFVLNVACNVATSEKKVLYVTLEDATQYQQRRAIARYADVALDEINRHNVHPDQYQPLMFALAKMATLPVWISDRGMTANEIWQMACSHKSVHGLDLLIIDHLQFVVDESEDDKEYKTLSSSVRAFAQLAKELKIPVLLASQLNRDLEKRGEKRPRMSDLHGSGQIEQIARAIWFMYRPHYYDHLANENQIELDIAKHTHGRTGRVYLWSKMSRMYVRDWDEDRDGKIPDERETVNGVTSVKKTVPAY